jgi:hypothetical protein
MLGGHGGELGDWKSLVVKTYFFFEKGSLGAVETLSEK